MWSWFHKSLKLWNLGWLQRHHQWNQM
jgi:hypothetical protein